MEERCIIKEGEKAESDFFRAQLNIFRKSKNAEPISMNLITRRLKDLGIEKKQKSNGKRYYIGIKLNKTEIGDEMDILDSYFDKKIEEQFKEKKTILDTFGEEIKF